MSATYDLIDRWQQHARSAARFLRSRGVISEDSCPRRCLKEEELERHFDEGREQVANLAAAIHAHTGCTLQERTALDFGCGFGRLALPLAERCRHVYGVDVSPAVLEDADRHARRAKVSNVEWLSTDKLAELSGRYDLVISYWVFSHIPSREGERTFATLIRGLRPGGVGAIHVTLRPSRALAGLFVGGRRSARRSYNPLGLLRDIDLAYPYLLMNSYSLNRLGHLLAEAGINRWHVRWHGHNPQTGSAQSCQSAILFFHKTD